MTGLYLHDYYNYDVIFYTAIGAGLVGFIFASMIKAENKSSKISQPVAWDRFFLFKGFNAGFALLLMGIPYGMIVTYIALYGREIGISSGIGMFFTFMAIGLTISRFISGKMVDRGKLVQVITWGTALSLLSFVMLAALKFIDNNIVLLIVFYFVSLLMGIGYGLIFPAYNTLFVNLAPNNRRATASSTYMTSWDIGIGLGLVSGGWLADLQGGCAGTELR
jgi:MFS family permease